MASPPLGGCAPTHFLEVEFIKKTFFTVFTDEFSKSRKVSDGDEEKEDDKGVKHGAKDGTALGQDSDDGDSKVDGMVFFVLWRLRTNHPPVVAWTGTSLRLCQKLGVGFLGRGSVDTLGN